MAVTVNAAVYGVAVYGVARYGKVIVSNLDQAVGTGQVSAVQVNTAAGVVGVSAIVGSIEPVSAGGFEIDITERITAGVEATGQSGTVQPNTAAGLTGVEATGSLPFVQPIVSPTKELVGVSGSLVFNPAQPNVTEPVGGLSATGSTGSLTLHTTAGITSAGMTLTLNKPDQTAVVFDFESVKETYSRKRTVYLSRVA